jgi:hypothetical protein
VDPHSCSAHLSEAETIEKLRQQLAYAELKIQALEAALRAERIKKYGPKSDTLPSAQLNLLEEGPGVSAEEIEAEAGREPIEKIKRTKADNKKKHPGRQQLPASLPRVERVITCSAEQCICSACGAETAVIGYDESEQLDVEPAKYFVNLTRREKRGGPRRRVLVAGVQAGLQALCRKHCRGCAAA